MSACAKHKHGQDLVDYLNSHQNFFKLEFRAAHLLRNGMTGVNPSSNLSSENPTKTLADYDLDVPIPTSYDPREDPECGAVINYITNQGPCADCWAHAAAGVMSDRICKLTGGKQSVLISPYDLTSCCSWCTPADQKCSSGCHTSNAFNYIYFNGVVTEQCKPVDSDMPKTANPQCTPGCTDAAQSANRFYGQAYYALPQDPQVIQREIMSKG
ncbi:cathepsin B-like cysteine proteinase, partial [Aphelenchoides avenae]